MAFYKAATLQSAPNFVYSPTYILLATEHENHTYPVDGWTWYDSDEEAYAAFGLPVPPPDLPPEDPPAE